MNIGVAQQKVKLVLKKGIGCWKLNLLYSTSGQTLFRCDLYHCTTLLKYYNQAVQLIGFGQHNVLSPH